MFGVSGPEDRLSSTGITVMLCHPIRCIYRLYSRRALCGGPVLVPACDH